MKFLCEKLGIRRLSVRDMTTLALLIAITVILAIYATFRVGNSIKIPLKFISVFVTGAMFGPIPAALTALLGDVLNTFLVPVGPWLPQISFVEALSGFIYGAFFYNQTSMSKGYAIRLVLCVLCQFALDMLITSLILTSVGYFPDYYTAIIIRLPAGVIKLALQSFVIALGASYLGLFKKIIKKAV